jgi:hypothetical protein
MFAGKHRLIDIASPYRDSLKRRRNETGVLAHLLEQQLSELSLAVIQGELRRHPWHRCQEFWLRWGEFCCSPTRFV